MKKGPPYCLKVHIQITCDSKEDLICHLQRVTGEIKDNFHAVRGEHVFVSTDHCLQGNNVIVVEEIKDEGQKLTTKKKSHA